MMLIEVSWDELLYYVTVAIWNKLFKDGSNVDISVGIC
jgi:hypothetical protein